MNSDWRHVPRGVLVANRGEIACRVLRTLRWMGIPSVAVYSEVDAEAPHVWLADSAVNIGEPRAYMDIACIIDAAQRSGATAIHPGYGFLAENAHFARACKDAGLVFMGPSPEAVEAFGDKRQARVIAEEAGICVVPGAQACDSIEEAGVQAQRVGFPVLLKAAAGGGGKGMRRVNEMATLVEAYGAAQREAKAAFGDGRLLVEKYIFPARHIEVQILGDGERAVAVGERDCSLQRRYQKVVEEAPAVAIRQGTRDALYADAIKLMQAVGYSGAGTVEFIVDTAGQHYFLEVNTRLQVEHPVTEMLIGWDLVAWQVTLAHGGALCEPPTPRGHAIEVRLNAEDAYGGFLPATGEVAMLHWPQAPYLRIDAGISAGQVISPHYDSLLAKIICWGEDRQQARQRLIAALRETVVLGLTTNQSFLIDVLQRDFFVRGEGYTTTLEQELWQAPEIPDYVHVAAQQAGAQTGSRVGDAGTDRFSPWGRLGAFRLARGPCT
ncbi:MAG: biotin carboxylase N-terminal domain-containing protein [Myxococcota bacterium]